MPKMPSMPGGRAKSSPSKLRRKEPGGNVGLVTAILVAVSLVLFTLSVREGGQGFFGSAKSVVQTIVSPIRIAGGYVVAPLSGMGNVFRNLTADEQTLSELKAENEQLRARNVELEEANQTTQRLEGLLELQNTYNLQSIAARVIAGSSDSWVASVSLDKGSMVGIRVGMPVTNAVGAVGQVIECSGTTSVVRLLTDEGSSVSAMVQSSRAQGMVEGSPDGSLKLTLIRTDQSAKVGDVVVTSGLGGVFPKGLPVGKITSIEKNPGSTYYDIVVEPFFKPQTLEEVLVITSLTEGQEATSEDIVEADKPDLDAASGKPLASDNSNMDVADGNTNQANGDEESSQGNSNSNSDGSENSNSDNESSQSGTQSVVDNTSKSDGGTSRDSQAGREV